MNDSEKLPVNGTQSQEEEKKSRLILLLDSKFFVTVIGGILLALFSNMWQTYWKNLEYARDLRETKYALMSNFSDDYSRALHAGIEMMLRRNWLLDKTNKTKEYYDFRGYEETRTVYEAYESKLQTIRSPDSYFAQSKGLFTSTELSDQAVKADKLCYTFFAASPKVESKQLIKRYFEAAEECKKFIELMAKEIRQESQKNERWWLW